MLKNSSLHKATEEALSYFSSQEHQILKSLFNIDYPEMDVIISGYE